MRFLIDGYNLMYAGGLLGKKLGPEAFRRVRHRFLNDLAEALGAVDAHQTTVVFDASKPPEGLSRSGSHKGLSVLYAVDDENADERIEVILARHSHPKTLTVVSSDRRVREAASRRRATAVTSEQFWTTLDARKHRKGGLLDRSARVAEAESGRTRAPGRVDVELTEEEAPHWQRAFEDVDAMPEAREALSPDAPMLTDADIARIAREVDREFGR